MEQKEKYYLFSKINPESYELILYPTEQCNFRCVYCYEDFEIGRMSNDVIEGIKSLIEKCMPKIKSLRLSWFGGEPLLAYSIIENISNFALLNGQGRDINVNGNMTTNGYLLTVDMMRKLLALKVTHYQISLDGEKNEHDKTRKKANGEGSFDSIMQNLLNLKQTDLEFNIMLRIHVTKSNYFSVERLAVFLKENFLKDKRFTILIKPVKNYGGPNASAVSNEFALGREASFDDMSKALYELAGVNNGVNMEAPNESNKFQVCYAALPNSYAIRADGRVQKCTVALDSDANTLGRISRDGSMSLDSEKLKKWMRGLESGNREELLCPSKNFPKKAVDRENIIETTSVD